MTSPAASELGKRSVEMRKKRLGEKGFNKAMQEIAQKPRPKRRKLTKA